MTSTKTRTLSRGDSAALVGFCIAGVLIAISVSVYSVIRIIELARGVDVPVLVKFASTQAPVEVALSAVDTVAAGLDSATITAPQLPAMAAIPGIIGQVLQIVTIVVVIGCLILLARSTLRGRIFSRGHTALVSTAGITGLVGFASVRFFDNMLANATVAAVTDNRVDTVMISIEPFTFILAAFVIALISTVFAIGDRLQRDTEGLV
ncbi:DUF2975 domain-containing protein [uncultured Microbacterium sp.]|uniref:DUF2975 domain-containing protein n=1 Tax=uncultured Microbacterium sp. TaxID=191216 RepID=UPI0028D4B161|nr:DUF2975 domain-containing protein [uncultured Microbacterium sp.]